MKFRGVLFDFGYTLFAHAPLAITIADCAERLGANIGDAQSAALADRIDAAAMTSEELRHPRDLDAAVWTQRWKLLYGIADEFVAGLGDELYTSMHDPMAWRPYRDAATTLQALHHNGVHVGVVSNTGWDVRRVFAAQSLSPFVTSFTLSYEVGCVKPAPKIFAAACADLGLAPGDVLMVGDDPRSDGGAVAAGIRTLLLPAEQPGTDNGLGSVLSLVTSSST